MSTSFDVETLVTCLSQLPPVELEAMRLLRELRSTSAGSWFPAVQPESVASATQELIAYTKACAALIDKLQHLAPVALPTLEIPAWPL